MSDFELPERPLTPAEQLVIADELRRLGYVVTHPSWLVRRDDDDAIEGWRIVGRGMDDYP